MWRVRAVRRGREKRGLLWPPHTLAHQHFVEPFSSVSWEFIGISSPAATVEGARRWAISACTTKLHSTAGLLHMGILPLAEAPALVRGSGVSFSRWCSCGVLSLTVYSGVWGIGVFAYLLGEEMDFVKIFCKNIW